MDKVLKSADEYMENTPADARSKLSEVRAAITEAAPEAVESISYGMPFYSFSGESGVDERLCYFGLSKDKKKIAFYTRPIFLERVIGEAKRFMTSKSALQFSLDEPIPVHLIKKIVANGISVHKRK